MLDEHRKLSQPRACNSYSGLATGDFLRLAGELAENGCWCLTNRFHKWLLVSYEPFRWCLTNRFHKWLLVSYSSNQ